MRSVKWLMLAVLMTACAAWYFLSFKTYSRQQIAANADMVLVVDVKKNTNSILSWYLWHPSHWSTVFKKKSGSLGLINAAVNIPDYLYFFHVADQPATAIFCLLTVKNNSDFQQLLTDFAFKKQQEENGQSFYFSGTFGIALCKTDNQLLVSTVGLKDPQLLNAVASQLFTQKQFIAEDVLNKITTTANHFTLFIKKTGFLQEDFLLNGHFTDGQLSAEGDIKPVTGFEVPDASFDIPDSSLMTVAFIQPSPRLYALLPDSLKTKTSCIFNFAMDSMFLQGNKKYLVDIASIKNRTDSAVTYEYDDDFNKVEKVVVNHVSEPGFRYTIYGDQPSRLYNYWKKNKQIEESATGNIFIPVPFVKTYVDVFSDSLVLTSDNYKLPTSSQQVKCIGNICIRTDRLPSNAAALLPDFILPIIQKIRSINIVATRANNAIKLNVTVLSTDRSLPFLSAMQ